ncbi:UNVERIFIED_CONTAM: DNA glycosylase/AP lyase ROS1 [Sesamum latifolium]|uniref:DNA glycosylase/AP lyase ROS1 n=1 Tax=Sesamum latifolium TaxID=2727402 RepID=A0AAW2X6I1_9LAMI
MRVWNLLMENNGADDTEQEDDDKAKYWKKQREIFDGRVDSFIARMHLIQGDRRFSPWKGSVVDSVVGVFLTQNVSDHLSSSAFMSLAARFPPPTVTEQNGLDDRSDCVIDEIRQAKVEELARVIVERGMNNILAGRIKDFLDRIVRDHGSIDLEWLRDVPPDKAKEYLLSIPGLGLKSVECVRLLTLRHHAFPVFCTKRRPNCNACPMRAECRHFASEFASTRLCLEGSKGQNTAPESSVASIQDTTDRFCLEEMPLSPEPECTGTVEIDIEDLYCDSDDEIPTIKLNGEEFRKNVLTFMGEEEGISKALFEKREPDDPCPYLLAIWTTDESMSSSQEPRKACNCQKSTCDMSTCCSGQTVQNENERTIPCRTANRGAFPLNGTYFQVNEVSSVCEESTGRREQRGRSQGGSIFARRGKWTMSD